MTDRETAASERPLLGDFLAQRAHVAAVAAQAFQHLAADLARLDAPAPLAAQLSDARLAELRHAQVLGAIARSRGGVPPALSAAWLAARSREDVALANGVRGVLCACQALVASHQASAAEDRAVRSAVDRIADDERRHAAVCAAVHAWLGPQLTPAGRERVQAAQVKAVRNLAAQLACPYDQALVQAAGLPPPELGLRLWAALRAAPWACSSAA